MNQWRASDHEVECSGTRNMLEVDGMTESTCLATDPGGGNGSEQCFKFEDLGMLGPIHVRNEEVNRMFRRTIGPRAYAGAADPPG